MSDYTADGLHIGTWIERADGDHMGRYRIPAPINIKD